MWFIRTDSLFFRIFLILALGSSISIIVTVTILYWRLYSLLDREAENRLVEVAVELAEVFSKLPEEHKKELAQKELEKRFGKKTNTWIHNSYWLELQNNVPTFIASLSALTKNHLYPPTIEDVEDLIDERFAELDSGQPAFPDPFAQTGARRFKIILYPILDEWGTLDSVVGLEADLQYLSLFKFIKETFGFVLTLALCICFAGSWLLAKNFSKKIQKLLNNLKIVEERGTPKEILTGINELDELQNGIVSLSKALEKRDRVLKELYESKLSELSLTGSAIAHEIRNPLAALETHVGLLKRRLSANNFEIETFNEILAQIAIMKRIASDFLDYSKKVIPQKNSFYPGVVIQNIIQEKIKCGVPILLEMKIKQELKIEFDENMFRQVIENLVQNSIEAKSENLTITVEAIEDDETIKIYFNDNGPGIPKEFLNRLFIPFVSNKKSGHGIGLALCRKLVEANGGRLLYNASYTGGASFIIEITKTFYQ